MERPAPFRSTAWAALALIALASGCGTRATPVEQAALLSQKGQDPAAVQVLEGELRKHPEKIPERRMLVRLHAVMGDLGAAEREAGVLAARLPPDSPVPWLELGHALELAHRYDEALALYDRAAAVAPHDPAGPRTGGLRAARWGEPELAAPRLEEALRRDSRDATVWHALGLVRLEDGDFTGAKEAYASGLVADPTALENRVGLATVALKEGQPARALEEYDHVLHERPSFSEGYLGRAWAFILLGRLDAATADLDEARRRGADARAIARQQGLIASLWKKSASGPRTGNP